MVTAFQEIFDFCFMVMKMKFAIFGYVISLWDVFLWCIVMVALLKLFFALFE